MANKLEYSCDVCSSKEAVALPYVEFYTGGQPLHVCKQCGFVYVKYRRSAQEIADAWSNECYGHRYTATIPAVVARQTFVCEFIDQAVGLSDKVLFDIGAGEGKFLEYAALRNCSVFGIEPSQANCDLMKQSGIRHFCGTIESYQASADFERDLADIVTVMWTLENCTSARNMIQAGVNLLKPGGHLVVSTGSRILVPFKKPLGTYLGNSPADLHCFRFSAQTLKKLLSSCGLTIVTSNEYLTNDILCVVAKKEGSSTEEHPGDNWRKVYDFFERWHKESLHYER